MLADLRCRVPPTSQRRHPARAWQRRSSGRSGRRAAAARASTGVSGRLLSRHAGRRGHNADDLQGILDAHELGVRMPTIPPKRSAAAVRICRIAPVFAALQPRPRGEPSRAGRGRSRHDDDRVQQPQVVALHEACVASSRPLASAAATEANAADRTVGQFGQGASRSSRSSSASSRARRSSGSAARRATSDRTAERRRRRDAASAGAARTTSDSVPPSRSNNSRSASDRASSRALTARDATSRRSTTCGTAATVIRPPFYIGGDARLDLALHLS